MSKDLNKIMIIGRLGSDPELRYTGNGTAVANVRIATSEKWKDGEHTEWHAVVFWARLGEIVSEFCRKGSKVYVEGSMRTRKYQDAGGNDRYVTEVRASELILLDPKSESRPQQKPPQKPQQPAQDDGFDEIPFN